MTTFPAQLWALTQSRTITAKTHLVLQALASFDGQRGLFPSHESIAARSGASIRTVIRALDTAYRLGIVERTRQRQRVSGRVCNGPNRYRLILTDLEQARAAAAYAAQRLREALALRKLLFSSNCQNGSESYSQSDIFSYKPRSKNEWLDLIASWTIKPAPT